tara:strand:+ start:3934 stop:5067 length:1134 start_codon:yes stop_codon:yes gene_type:complete
LINNFFKNINFENLIIFFLLIFVIITNNYFGENNINPSASSSEYYLDIAKAFPITPDFDNVIQSYIHAERFLISYLIGFINNLTNIKIFNLFCIFTYLLIIIFLTLNFKILNLLTKKNDNKILFFSLLLLNPYIVRYFLSNPVMLNDLIFITAISLLYYSFLKKKNYLFYISIIIAVISRQTSFIIILALLINFFLPIKKEFIDLKKILFSLLIILISYSISQYYLNVSKLDQFYDISILGLFYYFQNNLDYLILLKFFLYPFLSFGPLIILIFIKFLSKEIHFKLNEKNTFFIILILGIIAQPILAGPLVAGKNIIRLSSFVYCLSIFLFCANLKEIKFYSKKIIFISILFLTLWSMHPTFSKIKIFESLKINFNL